MKQFKCLGYLFNNLMGLYKKIRKKRKESNRNCLGINKRKRRLYK